MKKKGSNFVSALRILGALTTILGTITGLGLVIDRVEIAGVITIGASIASGLVIFWMAQILHALERIADKE